MSKIRVYQLAKELEISSKELIRILLEEFNVTVKNHMSVIEEEDAELIKEFLLEKSDAENGSKLEKSENAENEIAVEHLQTEQALERMEKSYAGTIGKAVLPAFKPLGFDDWRIPVALMGGFVAKEIVVGTMGTLYAAGDSIEEPSSLRNALRNAKDSKGDSMYTPIVAYSLMLFVLLYIPCVAVIAVVKKETNSWKWTGFSIAYSTILAWVVAFVIYQGGRLIGLG